MAGDLRSVLSRIGVRGAEEGHQDFVQPLDGTELQAVAGRLRSCPGTESDDAVHDGHRIRPAEADDGDGPRADGGRRSADCMGVILHQPRSYKNLTGLAAQCLGYWRQNC